MSYIISPSTVSKNYLTVKQMRTEMAEWMSSFHWDCWMTGTFRENDQGKRLKDTIKTKKYFEYFLNILTREKGITNGLDYFAAVEIFKTGEYTHIHALLNGVEYLKVSRLRGFTKEAEKEYYDIWEIWFNLYGRAHVEAYDPDKSATYYVTKYVVKDICDWAINIRPDSRNYKLF